MSSSHRDLSRKNTATTMERTAGTWKPIIAVHNLHGQGCALHNSVMEFEVKVASSARKHGISRSRIQQALNSQTFAATIPVTGRDPKIVHIGTDDRGVEIELIGVVLPSMLLIIHAMPTHYRRNSR